MIILLHLIYQVLGITLEQGQLIDSYQNTGRFLQINMLAHSLKKRNFVFQIINSPDGIKTKIENTLGQRPKTFEIDFLNLKDAIEVKWRDATTDGDHIIKRAHKS